MKITKEKNENGALTIRMEGQLDTEAAPEAEKAIGGLEGVTDLTIDMNGLLYISSSGIRMLAALQETMDEQGSMVIINADKEILQAFEITGLNDIFNIK